MAWRLALCLLAAGAAPHTALYDLLDGTATEEHAYREFQEAYGDFMDPESLQSWLAAYRMPATGADLNHTYAQVDADADGVVSFAELLAEMRHRDAEAARIKVGKELWTKPFEATDNIKIKLTAGKIDEVFTDGDTPLSLWKADSDACRRFTKWKTLSISNKWNEEETPPANTNEEETPPANTATMNLRSKKVKFSFNDNYKDADGTLQEYHSKGDVQITAKKIYTTAKLLELKNKHTSGKLTKRNIKAFFGDNVYEKTGEAYYARQYQATDRGPKGAQFIEDDKWVISDDNPMSPTFKEKSGSQARPAKFNEGETLHGGADRWTVIKPSKGKYKMLCYQSIKKGGQVVGLHDPTRGAVYRFNQEKTDELHAKVVENEPTGSQAATIDGKSVAEGAAGKVEAATSEWKAFSKAGKFSILRYCGAGAEADRMSGALGLTEPLDDDHGRFLLYDHGSQMFGRMDEKSFKQYSYDQETLKAKKKKKPTKKGK